MSFVPSEAEVHRLNNLPPEDRYKFFIDTVAKNKEAFAFTDGSGMGMREGSDCPGVMLMWPAMAFVDAYCLDEKREMPELTISVPVTLDGLFDHYLPELKRQGFGICVFPDPDGYAVEVPVDQFEADLRHAVATAKEALS